MSIQIIRPGKIKQPTMHERQCVECDCVFRYGEEDIGFRTSTVSFVRCPTCKAAVVHAAYKDRDGMYQGE